MRSRPTARSDNDGIICAVNRRLILNIEAGDTTCASKPGYFCKHVRGHLKGSYCGLFQNISASIVGKPHYPFLDEVDGWLKRLPECIAAERASAGES